MATPDSVVLVVGEGIAGDRYAMKAGHWSDPQWPDQEITLIEGEVLHRLGLDAAQLRRNIVTRGLSLPALIGKEFTIGESRLLGVRICDPCRYIEHFTRPGLMDEIGEAAGLRARILTAGTIHPNDRIEEIVASPTAP